MKPQAILRRVIEVCPFSIVVVEPLGKIALANDEAERMFGFAHDELIGQTVDLLVPTSLRAQHARHRSQFAAQPAIRLARNLSGQRKDGTEFPAEVGLNQIPTNEGFLVLAVIVDISEAFASKA
jgi:PAS domain S-box-containing protein